jgi:hypothetical protein
MYSSLPSFVLGFHGCDRTVAEKVISQATPHLIPSKNQWDWLGHGIYFWEHNYHRALEWARYLMDNPEIMPKGISPIIDPSAVGAIIDLGKCLNLLDGKSVEVVKGTYTLFLELCAVAGTTVPKNKGKARNLDCAVMNAVNMFVKKQKETSYDTIRGMFYEGNPLYEESGFLEKNHIQICVINLNCIKGYFHPLSRYNDFQVP